MAKVLLINPSMRGIYEKSKVKSSVPKYFPVSLLNIAAPLLNKNHEVKLLDLDFYSDTDKAINSEIKRFSPDYVGTTFNTPNYYQAIHISDLVKNIIPDATIIAGGPHITSDYIGTMGDSKIDIAVLGEGDFKFLEIVESKKKNKIKGIAYRKGKHILANEREPYIKNLDDIPFPAVELININSYKIPYSFCRKNPVFPLETSRGCVYGCVYCNKNIFGRRFRAKSVKRVMQDLRKITDLGYKEVHILDDGFTTDVPRAKEICQEMVREKIPLLVNCSNGVRADKMNLELLKLMKKAGFYSLAFGVESGSQRILDNLNKNLKLEDVEKACKLCREVGMEITLFFMFGLPGETEEDMKKTIEFAKKMKPDIVKFAIMIPFPFTPIHDEWKKKGFIKSPKWDDYIFHGDRPVYEHPNIPWPLLRKYLDMSYRSFYLSPNFIIRRFFKSVRKGTLMGDIKTFLHTDWSI